MFACIRSSLLVGPQCFLPAILDYFTSQSWHVFKQLGLLQSSWPTAYSLHATHYSESMHRLHVGISFTENSLMHDFS